MQNLGLKTLEFCTRKMHKGQPARLACLLPRRSLRSPASPPASAALASLAPRLLASLALSAARFARLACCSLRSPPLPPLAPLVASPALCLLCPALRSEAVCPACSLRSPPRLLLSLCSSARLLFAPLAASPAARFARRWRACWPLRPPAARFARLRSLAPAGFAHRLARLACSCIFCTGARSGQTCRIPWQSSFCPYLFWIARPSVALLLARYLPVTSGCGQNSGRQPAWITRQFPQRRGRW